MKNVGVGKVEIRKGESGLNAQWYVREGDGVVMGGEKEPLKYTMADLPPCVQNSKYFVHCHFEEHAAQEGACHVDRWRKGTAGAVLC